MRASPPPPTIHHKFRIGQAVLYRPGTWLLDAPGGTYEIVGRMPQRLDGEFEYRIRHAGEQHIRVARESELKPR